MRDQRYAFPIVIAPEGYLMPPIPAVAVLDGEKGRMQLVESVIENPGDSDTMIAANYLEFLYEQVPDYEKEND